MKTLRTLALAILALAAPLALATPAFADTQNAAAYAHTIAAQASQNHRIVTNLDITQNSDYIMQVPFDLLGTIAGHPRMIAVQMAWYMDVACITFPAQVGAAPVISACPTIVKTPASMATVVANQALFLANKALGSNTKTPLSFAQVQSTVSSTPLPGTIKASVVPGTHARDVLFTLSSDTVKPTHVCIHMPTGLDNVSVSLVGPNGSGSC